jgi:sec-independent protein translocase protein TatB
MFDITSSKLFLLAIVALLVIGPKDFPLLLRTIGKYVGIIRGHAKEFRAQFDEAMRETELSQLKKDVENIAQETESSLNATGQSVGQTFQDAQQSMEGALAKVDSAPASDPLPEAAPEPAAAPAASPVREAAAGSAADERPAAPDEQVPDQVAREPAAERTGV